MKTILKMMVLAVALQASVASALTGNDIKASSDDFFDGYISGVVDSSSGEYFCRPDGATYKQAADIVRHFLNDHPEALHDRADIIVPAVLHFAFPCATTKKSSDPKF